MGEGASDRLLPHHRAYHSIDRLLEREPFALFLEEALVAAEAQVCQRCPKLSSAAAFARYPTDQRDLLLEERISRRASGGYRR